jgi:hypothetical protein
MEKFHNQPQDRASLYGCVHELGRFLDNHHDPQRFHQTNKPALACGFKELDDNRYKGGGTLRASMEFIGWGYPRTSRERNSTFRMDKFHLGCLHYRQ